MKLFILSIVIIVLGLMYAVAYGAVIPPNDIGGCQYNLTQPTLTDGSVVALQCNSSGSLRIK